MGKKVLITVTDYDKLCGEGLKMLLDAGCEVKLCEHSRPYTQEELTASAGDADGVIASVEPWNAAVLGAVRNLKVIARFGTGFDSVDLGAAKEHGVVVANTPGLNAPAVAEYAVALMLSAYRRIPQMNESTRQGGWDRTIFHEFSELTVGILGFGNIGRRVAAMLAGFGCRILAFDVFPNREAAEKLGVELVGRDELLRQSDIITLHAACTAETRHMINAGTLALMKPTAGIVNTARGGLVDEKAVSDALEQGKLAFFAADVFDSEPLDLNGPLAKQPNFISTPHYAAQTFENYRNTGVATAKAVLAVFSGEEPEHRLA